MSIEQMKQLQDERAQIRVAMIATDDPRVKTMLRNRARKIHEQLSRARRYGRPDA